MHGKSSARTTGLSLFDDNRAPRKSYKEYGEGSFDFLSRSTSAFSEAFRGVIDSWFSEYPENAKAQLRGRFRSDRETDHAGALFEIYLHNMLSRMGLDIQVEQPVSNGSKPDFLGSKPTGEKLYIEAATIEDESENLHLSKVLNDINNELICQNFFLAIRTTSELKKTPRTKRLIKTLRSWLDRSDPDAIVAQLPSRVIHLDDDCDMEITLIPRSPELRDQPARIIGSPPSGSHWGDASAAIKRTLEKKARRYGPLDAPFLIALNVLPWYHSAGDIRGILFGDRLSSRVAGSRVKSTPNSFWGQASAAQSRNVSAVIATGPLVASTLHVQKPVLYHNPWAFHPIDQSTFLITQVITNEQGESKTITFPQEVRDLIGLPKGWPPSHQPA